MVTPRKVVSAIICILGNKCEECALWTDDVFSNYLRLNLELTRFIQDMNSKPSKDELVNYAPIRDQGNAHRPYS